MYSWLFLPPKVTSPMMMSSCQPGTRDIVRLWRRQLRGDWTAISGAYSLSQPSGPDPRYHPPAPLAPPPQPLARGKVSSQASKRHCPVMG